MLQLSFSSVKRSPHIYKQRMQKLSPFHHVI